MIPPPAQAGRGISLMHTIKPASLKSGAAVAAAPAVADKPIQDARNAGLIRGRALIIWDPKVPGKKRDARWKSGAFRHLIPDFRARVHRGETFLIAGDRFAIGSSREMSPAGLKAVAEEAGLELVVVCGRQMGDIFRRNAFNLGLHVLECPEAVADAQDGDTLTFDPTTRALANETQGRAYQPVPLAPKEEEIRRDGGIFAVGRRELRRSIERTPRIIWPDETLARRMSTTEQILWAHRVDAETNGGSNGGANTEMKPGATLRLYADLLPASDGTAPFAIHTFNQITGGQMISPRQAAIANDHFVFTGRDADAHQTAIGKQFAERHGIDAPYYATPGDGIFHFYFPEQGLIYPGQFVPGADSHSRAYGAYGAVGIGVGSTTLGFGWATGYVYATLPKQRRVRIGGTLCPWVGGKDIVLELLRRWGTAQAQGMSVEFVDERQQLPIVYRNTIANMMAEAEAWNGIFAPDAITLAWYRAKGIGERDLPYPVDQIKPGEDARYELEDAIDLSVVQPMIAKPFSPGNAHPAEDVARERLTFDKAMIGSCTNGSYDDLLQAALVVRAARSRGADRAATSFLVFPGSGGVARQIERHDPRLAGESIADVFRSVGAQIRQSWCGPCFGQGPDALTPGQRAITSFNRNWQNRMGVGGEGYLASPAVVAASALLGYMAPPSELGLKWDAEAFGV
jgi:3-isopropylmalate/(R)-2-methylmalate dehydratase large subunit